jgi:hypothetical protein
MKGRVKNSTNMTDTETGMLFDVEYEIVWWLSYENSFRKMGNSMVAM